MTNSIGFKQTCFAGPASICRQPDHNDAHSFRTHSAPNNPLNKEYSDQARLPFFGHELHPVTVCFVSHAAGRWARHLALAHRAGSDLGAQAQGAGSCWLPTAVGGWSGPIASPEPVRWHPASTLHCAPASCAMWLHLCVSRARWQRLRCALAPAACCPRARGPPSARTRQA